jgi:hypothetical protein
MQPQPIPQQTFNGPASQPSNQPVQPAPTPAPKSKLEPMWKRQPGKTFGIMLASLISLAILSIGLISWLTYSLIEANNQRDVATAQADKYWKNLQSLANIWEKQASLNDIDYQGELRKNFKLVNNVPQGNPGQDIEKLRQTEDRLYRVLSDIDKNIEDNAKSKETLKKQVDEIYKELEKEQNRRFNPREGVR